MNIPKIELTDEFIATSAKRMTEQLGPSEFLRDCSLRSNVSADGRDTPRLPWIFICDETSNGD